MVAEHDLWLLTYKNAVGKECYMAIFEQDRGKALASFIANREPTDRLIGETPMTKRQYKDWKDGL